MIIAALNAREFAHFVDDDGDIGGNWQGCLIYFFRLGEAGGGAPGPDADPDVFSTDDVPRLYAFCNAWNHDRLWPKAYVHTADDGAVRVVGEVVGRLGAAASPPEQLDQVMICGIATGLRASRRGRGA